MKRTAPQDGYELAYSEESYGEHFFGLQIYVKMSNRKLCERDDFYKAARDIKRGLETVTAELDPEGSAKRETCRAEIEGIYKAAGVTAIFMESLPNGYCSDPCCLNKPWFRVTSAIGHVTIGWRKRVLSIEWKDSIVKATGEALFPTEDVTRWETGIHAWKVDKAVEYVRRLHEAVAK